MKKLLSTFLLLFLFACLSIAQTPNEILGIAKEKKSKEYYQEQAALWKKETTKNSKSAYAWWQRYKAERAYLQLSQSEVWANNQGEIFGQLKPVIAEAKKHVGNSFEYYLIESDNTKGKASFDFAKKAHAVAPDRKEVFGLLLIHYGLTFQEKQATEIAKKMLETNYYSNANLTWNYNALQTVAPGGVFISNGDMDAMPKWVLQYGKGIRKDVLMVSKWMLATDEDYRKKVFEKMGLPEFGKTMNDFANTSEYVDHLTAYVMKNSSKPVYTSCGTSVKFFKDMGIHENIYLVGVAFLYSKQDFDNLEVTINNFENKYHLDYLLNNFQIHPEDEMVKKHMNLTYLPGLMKLKKHFEKTKNKERENYYSSLINQIAKESGREKEVLSWF